MRKQLLTLLLLTGLLLPLAAQNYPYRSDYLWVTVPDHADWVYKTGEKAKIDVQFLLYGMPQDGTVTYSIGYDLLPSDKSGKAELKKGHAVIDMGTSTRPGFRDLRLELNLGGTVYRHHVKVGFSPEKIKPYTQEPTDFMTFWQKAAAEVQGQPLSYTKDYMKEMSDEVTDVYLVRLKVDKRHVLYGYLLYPKNAREKSCPVVFTPPGAGVKTIKEVTSRPYYQQKGMIRFVTEIHGMRPTMDEHDFEDIRSAFSEYLEMGLDSPDRYYMRHV